MTEGSSSCIFDQHRYYMTPKTYVTKRDGQILLVRERRERRSSSSFTIGLDLLNNAFKKHCNTSTGCSEVEVTTVNIYETSDESQSSEEEDKEFTTKIEDKKKRLIASPTKQSCSKSSTSQISSSPQTVTQEVTIVIPSNTSSTMTNSKDAPLKPPKVLIPPPPPGIYKKGNQQLALLPLSQVSDVSHMPQCQPQTNCHSSHAQASHPVPPGCFINSYGFVQAVPHSSQNAPLQQQQSYHIHQQQQHPCFHQNQHHRYSPQSYGDCMAFAPMTHGGRVFSNGIDATSSTKPEVKQSTKEDTKSSVPKCAGCGKERSRRFQHNNPIKDGETPPPSFCRKCQRQDTSSDNESDVEIKIKTSAARSLGRNVAKTSIQVSQLRNACSCRVL